MRTLVIGDIHGCSGSLDVLLSRAKPDPSADRLVLLGDLFDRGPDSWEVFQKVKELEAAFQDRFVLLRGNHEDYLLQPKLSVANRIVWERVGRGATVRSFKEHGEAMESAIPWLEKNCVMYWKAENFQCVHAGLLVDPPEMNDTYTLLHDHAVVLANQYSGPLTVVGHIALKEPTYFAGDKKTKIALPEGEWRPLPEKGILCIDTGCGKGGRLTGMLVEGRQYMLLHEAER